MLQIRGHTYEMYRYVHGREDSKSLEDAHEAGRTLAMLHRAVESFQPRNEWTPSVGTYHDSSHVPTALTRIPKRFDDPDRREVTLALMERYKGAAARARGSGEGGRGGWTLGPIIHGDWHPGNVLYALPTSVSPHDSRAGMASVRTRRREDAPEVVCVLDFDSARPGPRVIDVANGALQFSMARRFDQAALTPDAPAARLSESKLPGNELDLDRYRAFIDGYHFGLGGSLSPAEREAVPWLMIEALIAEAAIPIAITGRFGKVDPMGLLRVVRRKTKWITDHAHLFRIGG